MKQSLKKLRSTDKKDLFKGIVFLVLMVTLIVVTIKLMPWIISLKDQSGREALQKYIYEKGVWGVFLLVGLQIMQVIIAFIPGEPIEIVGGLLYGTFFGYAICTIGMLIGTVIIYYTIKLLGTSFMTWFIDEKQLDSYKFLKNTQRLEGLTFLLFFIPGTPKDLITYFMPLTKIKPMTFFIIVTVARCPSIISSTFAGASIGDGKWVQTIIIFAVIGIVAVLGIVFNKVLISTINKRRDAFKRKFRKD